MNQRSAEILQLNFPAPRPTQHSSSFISHIDGTRRPQIRFASDSPRPVALCQTAMTRRTEVFPNGGVSELVRPTATSRNAISAPLLPPRASVLGVRVSTMRRRRIRNTCFGANPANPKRAVPHKCTALVSRTPPPRHVSLWPVTHTHRRATWLARDASTPVFPALQCPLSGPSEICARSSAAVIDSYRVYRLRRAFLAGILRRQATIPFANRKWLVTVVTPAASPSRPPLLVGANLSHPSIKHAYYCQRREPHWQFELRGGVMSGPMQPIGTTGRADWDNTLTRADWDKRARSENAHMRRIELRGLNHAGSLLFHVEKDNEKEHVRRAGVHTARGPGSQNENHMRVARRASGAPPRIRPGRRANDQTHAAPFTPTRPDPPTFFQGWGARTPVFPPWFFHRGPVLRQAIEDRR
ncbi:hypothetical protein B0H17DRAFT_1178044 [Mycena rosella]|uniref:Uncharacterized protein n=1 Tax=Mycena rosella TaxID=1033263 RepID=A0AAD7DQL9_MYCRO|nr:hypothetical protein B0H17DRAFT_1178044 [Mycena rosella]